MVHLWYFGLASVFAHLPQQGYNTHRLFLIRSCYASCYDLVGDHAGNRTGRVSADAIVIPTFYRPGLDFFQDPRSVFAFSDSLDSQCGPSGQVQPERPFDCTYHSGSVMLWHPVLLFCEEWPFWSRNREC